MKFPFVTEAATFLARPNRYRIEAQLATSGAVVAAHCPNPGRLGELLVPGATVHVSRATNPERRTAYDLRFVEHPGHGELVSLDTRLPNQLFAEGLRQQFFTPFTGYTDFKQEVTLPHMASNGAMAKVRSRIDFQLFTSAGTHCWVEVKSASLVVDGCARFPDAVTARGRRHVLELATLAANGEHSAIVFIVQRADAHALRPQWETDPAFGEALAQAQAKGVAIYAYTCTLTVNEAHLQRAIPVYVDQHS
ncbi:MAG TPA: DNA/RNA nuclease SfsA [Caldilineaceae bacterium]|nr:DNA/RNA nuclease SfsA [Caldilineaceae bacterium]